jgi:hypothetical protein
MRKLILVIVLLVFPLIGATTLAETKPATLAARIAAADLPLEVRLARRFDPAIRAQVRAANGVTDADTIVLDGRQHPELFTPGELFQQLISMTFRNPATVQFNRLSLSQEARQAGMPVPDNLWDLLASSRYVANIQDEQRLAGRLAGATTQERQSILAEIAKVQIPQCALRAEALAVARASIGEVGFDRFLYTAVAPKITMRSVGESVDKLRYVEGGCQ